jgi:hypothetical protein
MTSAEEAEFIALWEQGATYRELAAALRCPLGTVASLRPRWWPKEESPPRPRGGAYPSRRAQAQPEGAPVPVQRPV